MVDGPAAAVGPWTLAEACFALRPGTRQRPAVAGRDSFADLLPPVQYPRRPRVRPDGGRQARREGAAPAAMTPVRRQASVKAQLGMRRLLALLTMTIAVAASVLLPSRAPWSP